MQKHFKGSHCTSRQPYDEIFVHLHGIIDLIAPNIISVPAAATTFFVCISDRIKATSMIILDVTELSPMEAYFFNAPETYAKFSFRSDGLKFVNSSTEEKKTSNTNLCRDETASGSLLNGFDVDEI